MLSTFYYVLQDVLDLKAQKDEEVPVIAVNYQTHLQLTASQQQDKLPTAIFKLKKNANLETNQKNIPFRIIMV
jgi:hypothetical protein